MIALILTAVASTVLPAAFAPQLDFATLPPPQARPKFITVEIEARLASGKVETSGFDASNDRGNTGQSLCDGLVRWYGSQRWTCKLDEMKITLFDVNGDRIVGVEVRTTGKDVNGNVVPVLGPAFQWVKRVPPKITWTYLTPTVRGASLARMISAAQTLAVTTIAAPEIDFAVLPDSKDRPRVYYMWFYVKLASGDYAEKYGSDFQIDAHNEKREQIRANFINMAETWYDLHSEAGTKVVLWDHFEELGDGKVKRDRVVGLAIESNGPPPAVRWTLRPKYRKLLDERK